jgi:hypothetical protein
VKKMIGGKDDGINQGALWRCRDRGDDDGKRNGFGARRTKAIGGAKP